MHARTEFLQERGEITRQRLIDAALAVFGEVGFEGASTRMLADKANVNLAAIPYHFRSKEGLYCAVAQYIVDRMTEQTVAVLDEIEQALPNPQLSRKEALRLLHKYIDTLVTILVGSKQADAWSAFIMREQIQPGAAFEILYEGMMRRIGDATAGLLAPILRQPKNDPAIILRAIAIFGQILIFQTGRNTALRRLDWKEFTSDRLKLIQSIIRDNVDRIATARI